ncbi:MAG: glutaminyl-peptide cyclotransferase [Candidatus Thermoplasmatota archaeon]|nr:glutaminyl-peptide cyclotransferase [Candidatus Thermoplasmatota archaeon]
MERRSYVMATMRLTVIALVIFSVTIPLSSSMASKSFTYDLIKSIDHDPQAFTQGLEIDEGIMYESTGLYGHSQLREISTTDGSLIRSVDLPSTVFGEGLTVTGQTVLVLTWKSGIIFEFEKDNFTQVGEHSLEGEGWGICSFNDRLFISNGTNALSVRDPETLDPIGSLVVGEEDEIWNLNELECHGNHILANQWMTPFVHIISASSGEVLSSIDLSGLPSGTSGDRNEVMNGIAWDEDSEGYWITGKNWTYMHLVSFSEGGNAPENPENLQNEAPTLIGGIILITIFSFVVGMGFNYKLSPSDLIIDNDEG